jgi:hypothetical protein
MQESLKLFLVSLATPTYENVDRPEKFLPRSAIELLLNYGEDNLRVKKPLYVSLYCKNEGICLI